MCSSAFNSLSFPRRSDGGSTIDSLTGPSVTSHYSAKKWSMTWRRRSNPRRRATAAVSMGGGSGPAAGGRAAAPPSHSPLSPWSFATLWSTQQVLGITIQLLLEARVVLDCFFFFGGGGRLDSDSCDNPDHSTLTQLNTLFFLIDSTPTQLKSQIC